MNPPESYFVGLRCKSLSSKIKNRTHKAMKIFRQYIHTEINHHKKVVHRAIKSCPEWVSGIFHQKGNLSSRISLATYKTWKTTSLSHAVEAQPMFAKYVS